LFGLALHVPPLGFQRRFDGHRLNRAEKLSGDRRVDAEAAEGEAPRQPEHLVGTLAPVDGLAQPPARVTHHQAAPATATGQKPGEQRPSASPGLRSARLAVGVDRELLLVPFELGPIDIAFVVILEQNLPLFKRLAVTVALPGATLDDLGALLAFSVGVDARIERVLEHGDDAAVTDRRPLEGDQFFAVGGPRKMDLLGAQRQQDLSRAAHLAEPGEDQPDRFLNPQVGIKAETDLAMPDVADRHADAQFAAPGLGAGGVEHAGAQNAELELADAALHPEQQPIVRPAGIVDAVEVDHARLDQAAELKQMMPVATVPGETGGVEAQHRPHLPSA